MANTRDLDHALTVGVTGHRPNRLAMTHAALRRTCTDVLGSIARHAGTSPLMALSPLAEGADRAFAEAALTCDYQLHAILPFASGDYETTFSDQSEMSAYRQLLARCTDITELDGELSNSTDAYAALGETVVAASDLVAAVWDGRPAAGKGGTPEVIVMALSAKRPVIWIDALGQAAPRLLGPPAESACNLETAQRLAGELADRDVASIIEAILSVPGSR